MKFQSDWLIKMISHSCRNSHGKRKVIGKSFSLYYNDLARWLFITLAFTGLLATGWFGIPLAPRYLSHNEVNIIEAIFTLTSALGTIWGVMAYREFTNSADLVVSARDLARSLDPMIGEYEYRSYNPETREYENGYVPLGPVDFWDKETHAPVWLDKGKYWHILLGLQTGDKDIMLQVVKDRDLPFSTGKRNVAVTQREQIPRVTAGRSRKRYRYRVKIPQWLVMNTERARFSDAKERLTLDDAQLSSLIADLNKKLVGAADEVIERERPRIQYPWRTTGLAVYLNKSLPLRILYKEILGKFPGVKKNIIEATNANLANIKDEDLVAAILDVARQKGISVSKIENIKSLIKFLQNQYTKQGIGEGSSEYHNFHHSLEVTYMALQMLGKQFRGYSFDAKDSEIILIAGLLHDYDPGQAQSIRNDKGSLPKGPKVARTIAELHKTRIHDAFFTMNSNEFISYLRDYRSALLPPVEFAATHPEYVKVSWRPTESTIVEALIWRTDFPYFKQELAQTMFEKTISELVERGQDAGKVRLLAEILWLADLAVTYMGSDPIRAWDRVTNLYDELYLPKVEAVFRTDAFFSDFAEIDLFKEIIGMRHFPDIFRQRWNMIYQFFHEGNPSTQLNRTIAKARRLYSKINLEINMRKSDLLLVISANHWSEYFIGIGRDQSEVLRAKSQFAELDPQNASVFWGDTQKLLPNISNKSIDNFLISLPYALAPLGTMEEKLSFRTLLAALPQKLTRSGSLQVLTDIDKDSMAYRELMAIAGDSGLQLANGRKSYFPNDWSDQDFIRGKDIQTLIFVPKE